MSQYRIADCARADLDEIWTYIAQDDPDQRLTVLVYHVRACCPSCGFSDCYVLKMSTARGLSKRIGSTSTP